MSSDKVICTKCARRLEAAGGKLVELERRQKITCDSCGKRRYGCRVRIVAKGK